MAAEEIVIDKDRSKKQTAAKKPQQKDTQVICLYSFFCLYFLHPMYVLLQTVL